LKRKEKERIVISS